MHRVINSPFTLGQKEFSHRLIQGPLAGFSCAPMRELFYQFIPPAYCVTEMISAHDVLNKHTLDSRYLYRAAQEKTLCYQISGTEPRLMAEAASYLADQGADLIDINCGCPKTKIRKKGAGSALLENPQQLIKIIRAVRQAITIPLTIKIRIQHSPADLDLAKAIEDAEADALIVHGRSWTEDYDQPSDMAQIAKIKNTVSIPVIANGDIADKESLFKVFNQTNCDAFMIARAGTGKPWLYQMLLSNETQTPDALQKIKLFITHLNNLAILENEHQALLQSKSLVRYYFQDRLNYQQLQTYYQLQSLKDVETLLLSLFQF